MIPVLSFFFLKGKCKTCKTRISIQYPIVEFIAGITFVIVYLRQLSLWPVYSSFQHGLLYSVLFCVYYAFVFGLLLVIVVYDVRHKIIPNELVFSFIGLGLFKMLLFIFLKHGALTSIDIFDVLSPFILSIPLALLWLISGGRWIGLGDAKLVFGIGALLGLVYGVSAVILAFWIGALWSIGLMIAIRLGKDSSNRLSMNSEIPFAPFLILATVIAFYSHLDVFSLKDFLNILQ